MSDSLRAPVSFPSKVMRLVKRQYHLLLGAFILMGLAGAGSVFLANFLYERHYAEAAGSSKSLSYMVADHINGSVEAVDQSVTKVVERLQSHKPLSVTEMMTLADSSELQAMLDDTAVENPYLETVMVIAPDGRADLHSRTGAMPAQRIAESDYMSRLRHSPRDAYYMSTPFQILSSRVWMINFSKRVSAPDGTFLGVVAGIVKLSALSNVFDKVELGVDGSVAVFRTDGDIVSWAPQAQMPFGSSMHGTSLLRDFVQPRQDGVTHMRTPGDGVDRLIAITNDRNYPLATVISLPMSDVEADWYEQVRVLAIFTIAVMLGILLYTLSLAWKLDKVADERERQLLAKEIMKQAQKLTNVIENVNLGIAMFDSRNKLLFANERYGELYNIPLAMLTEGTPRDTLQRAGNGIGKLMGKSNTLPDGTVVEDRSFSDATLIRQRKKMLTDGAWVSVHEDITVQSAKDQKILDMATKDALTGLYNRVAFREALDKAVDKCRRGNSKAAVFYLDLDRFKAVNDTLGHPAGDELLRQVSARILAAVRKGDTVARFGGDEFAIIQDIEVIPRDPSKLAERLIATVSAPYDIGGNRVVIGTSIGISLAPGDAIDSDELLRTADLALYHSKANGKGNYNFFDGVMDQKVQLRRALENDLRAAIINKEFELYYQPVVSMPSRDVRSFEALIRWRHPVRGFVSPGDFIPVAEEAGLIVPIGEWVLREACLQAAKLPSHLKVGVNVSPAQFRSPGFLKSLTSAIEEAGIDGSRLIVEITEGVMIKDKDQAIATIGAIHALGIVTAMDDFGTGYSSLSYLEQLKFNKIKIDKSFVAKLGTEKATQGIVRATIAMAGALGMVSVAEGIETEEQMAMLCDLGCEEAQGYLISRPMPVKDIYNFLGIQEPVAVVKKVEPAVEKRSAPVLFPAFAQRQSSVIPINKEPAKSVPFVVAHINKHAVEAVETINEPARLSAAS